MTSINADIVGVEEDELDHDMLDVDFLSSQSTTSSRQSAERPVLTHANKEVLKYIDSTFENIMSALARELPPEVVLKHTGYPQRATQENSSHGGYEVGNTAEKFAPAHTRGRSITYSWSGKREGEARRFACLLAILVEIKKAIENGITVTKRDIYYRDPELYKKQETVDRFVDDIAATCNVTRKDLRVTASPKGLLCGLTSTDEVLMVPEDPSVITPATVSHLGWILVVEKEASFKSLFECAFHRSSSLGSGLIVTGKGYPDLNTKHFLRHILDHNSPQTRVFGLFDGDPDGLDIYRNYRVGSKRLSQEANCNLPEMKWLGVNIEEFLEHAVVMNEAVRLTDRDRHRMTSMLGRKEFEFSNGRTESNTSAMKQRTMLQYMLMLNVKMEIQAVEKAPGGLCGWLTKRILAS